MAKSTNAVATNSYISVAQSDRRAKLQIRCTDAEKLAWESLAKEAKLSLSDLVRHKMGRKMSKAIPSHDPALIRQLAGIGNNLNQVALLMSINKLENSDKLLGIITLIKQLMSEILKAKNHAAD